MTHHVAAARDLARPATSVTHSFLLSLPRCRDHLAPQFCGTVYGLYVASATAWHALVLAVSVLPEPRISPLAPALWFFTLRLALPPLSSPPSSCFLDPLVCTFRVRFQFDLTSLQEEQSSRSSCSVSPSIY